MAAGLLVASPTLLSACSLTNPSRDACEDDAGCAVAFGVGSTCSDGYCSEPGTCTTGHDCRSKYGGGACVLGACRMFLPENAQCSFMDPPDLAERPLAGDGATQVIGAIFATDDEKNKATAEAVILAAREIDDSTGLADGQRVGVVVCDNGGPGNSAQNEERTKLDQDALDHLAGTLGVPFLVGPRTSSDALKIIARLLEKQYPTVVISPSATSPELTSADSRLDPADPHPLFWRTCPSDALQATVLAQNVVGADVNVTTATVVYANDAYGQGFSDVFLNTFGVGQTELVPFQPGLDAAGATNAAGQVAMFNSDGVVIVSTSGKDTVALMTALVAAGLGTKSYFFTDGSKDAATLLAADVPPDVASVIASAKGTAPANARDEATFKKFTASLGAAFPGVDPSKYSFIAHAYDATYLGALGTVYAATRPDKEGVFDGRDVAAGMAQLSSGAQVELGPVTWTDAKQTLTDGGQLDALGISGQLNLDPALGEGPSPIEVWVVSADGTGFTTESIF